MVMTLNTPKAQSTKEIIDKMYIVKVKNFCSEKDIVKRIWRKATEQEKIFAIDTFDKGLLSKIYKELLKLNNEKTNSPIKKWAKDFTGTSSKKIYTWQQISTWNDGPHYVSSGKCKLK